MCLVAGSGQSLNPKLGRPGPAQSSFGFWSILDLMKSKHTNALGSKVIGNSKYSKSYTPDPLVSCSIKGVRIQCQYLGHAGPLAVSAGPEILRSQPKLQDPKP